MPRPAPQNQAQWIQQTARDAQSQSLRPVGIGPIRYGTVQAWTSGRPPVLMADDASIVEAGAWPNGYTPTAADVVMVIPWKPSNGQVYIEKITLGAYPELRYTALNYQNGWKDYDSNWNPGGVVKTHDGIVCLSGLVAPPTTSTNTLAVIAILPEGYRPEYDLYFDTNVGDTWRCIVVRANGTIQLITDNGASTNFATLEGICFPAAGVGNWISTGLAFVTGFTELRTLNGDNFPPVSYWLDDANGLVWWRGMLLHPTAVTTDNTPMVTFPATAEPENVEHHFASETNSAWGAVGINSTNSFHSLNWKIGNQTTNTQLSLNRVRYPMKARMDGFTYPTLASSWTTNASFTKPGWKVLPNGMIYVQGFMLSGTVGTAAKIWNQPPGTSPTKDSGNSAAGAMFNRPSNSTNRARILGDGGRPNKAWSIEQGNNGWVSFDGIMYYPRS